MTTRRSALVVIGVVVGLLVGLELRAMVGASLELSAARTSLEEGNPFGAVVHYGMAVRWHAPLNPYSGEALGELVALCDEAAATGPSPQALSCYDTARGALRSIAHYLQPFEDVLATVDAAIAEELALLGDQDAAEMAALLAAPTGPSPLFSWLVVAGFGLLLLSVITLIRGLRRGPLSLRGSWPSLVGALAGLVMLLGAAPFA